ncbi:LOW QUALITY PROTEIN: alpha-methylacyl-CoA racemase [Geomicrobium sp. JCM 19055]|nr:LOW QUALITY PROTEIN: alpha-methylacyl-CoA racemase [Geomicrobium sp. JCM 19055]
MGDYARESPPIVDGDGAMFHSLNRNKKSVTLDLKSDEGRDQFLTLVKEADVLVEGFRPGVMERLSLGYEEVKRVNVRIVYCSITGYGQTGPYAKKAGHDVNFISTAGLLNLIGDETKPQIPAAQIGILVVGGLTAAVGILVALLERERSGEGQYVDISMMDGAVSWMQTFLPHFLMGGKEPSRGNMVLSGKLACYETYETKDGRWFAVGALEPKFWKNFCEKLGRLDLIEQHRASSDVQRRVKHEVQSEFYKRDFLEWQNVFLDADACVTPVLTLDEMVDDPQINDRQMILPYGAMKTIGFPIKLSRTPAKLKELAPKLGQHNQEVLAAQEQLRET